MIQVAKYARDRWDVWGDPRYGHHGLSTFTVRAETEIDARRRAMDRIIEVDNRSER